MAVGLFAALITGDMLTSDSMPICLIPASRSLPRWLVFLLAAAALVVLLTGCGASAPASTCEACHQGLEHTSPTHTDCVACHGGDATQTDKKLSHRTMFGPKNPSEPQFWQKTCGRCHPYQLERMRGNLMYTNTGMVKNIQATWEGEDPYLYATRPEEHFNALGEKLDLRGVASLNNLAGELYRKFCALCHVAIENNVAYASVHAAGCAACHYPYDEQGIYRGGDETVKGKFPYSKDHRLANLPDNQVCVRCHNRSGRIALNYQGLNDGNDSLVPTKNGEPGPVMVGGGRNLTHITPDIHFAKGLDCIDCHTSRDIMGDGYAYENMYLQTEVSCEDCHGSATDPPRSASIVRENEEPVRESRHYQVQMRPGMQMVLTSKDRKYSNVFVQEGKVWVLGKRSGKLHESKVITGTPEHTVAGHQRLECYTCHSGTVAQCYGCHTKYDLSKRGRDFIRGVDTPGAFSETEDYRMLYPFPLAINQRGKVSPVTPGCQTFVTVVNRHGDKVRDEYVTRFKGRRQLRFAPFYGHNTWQKAVGCQDCHADPAFLGFGQHVVENDDIRATLICDKSEEKPLDGFLTMDMGRVRDFSGIVRENSRPLRSEEIYKILAVNQCLVCHQDAKDPIYQTKLDYAELDNCLHRAGLAGSDGLAR